MDARQLCDVRRDDVLEVLDRRIDRVDRSYVLRHRVNRTDFTALIRDEATSVK